MSESKEAEESGVLDAEFDVEASVGEAKAEGTEEGGVSAATLPGASTEPKLPKPPVPPAPLQPREGISGRANARVTLVGLSFVFLVTLFAWGGAKAKCNLHPPQSEAFKPSPLSRLASTPKDGALEFHYRLALLDFDGARELAIGEAKAIVDEREANCDQECLSERDDRKAHALTRAILLRREGRTAVVSCQTHYDGSVEEATYRVEWHDRLWKVNGLVR